MKYVCIDVETTGLNREKCQVIEFAAVIRDTDLDQEISESPSFHCLVKHDFYHGEPYALNLNARIFKELSDSENSRFDIFTESELVDRFKQFLLKNGFKESKHSKVVHFVAGGKNFAGFDLQFLNKLPNWENTFFVSSRVLDPGMLWIEKDDKRVPGLNKCLQRANIEKEVTHHALQDVYDTCQVIELGLKRLWEK